MAEVDYSEFVYRRKREEGKNIPPPEKPKKGGLGKFFYVFAVLLLIGGIIFFCADFFSKGKIIESVDRRLRGNSYEYYFVVGEKPGPDGASAQSVLIRKAGGSGYIIRGENEYLVVFSQYVERSEAESVANKNFGAKVYASGFTAKNTKLYDFLDGAVADILRASYALENGEKPESEFAGMLKTYAEKGGEFVSSEAEKLTAAEVNLLEFFTGGLESLDATNTSRLDFLSDVRYFLSGLIISMKKTAG